VSNPLIEQGIETFPLRPAAAARRNSSGGLLVIYVQPQTPAFKAGLQPTDVIEAINGQPVLRTSPEQFQLLKAASYALSVVRDKQKLVLMVDVPAK
jgi:S1-C subfamily serine protease